MLPGPADLLKELLHGHLVPLLGVRSFPGSLSGDLEQGRGNPHTFYRVISQDDRISECTETTFTSWPISSMVLKRLLKSMMTNGFHIGGKEAWYG